MLLPLDRALHSRPRDQAHAFGDLSKETSASVLLSHYAREIRLADCPHLKED
jgi:hypothetical protein